ncbi:MAG: HD domain-containing protein [Nannocystaceae bacterium]
MGETGEVPPGAEASTATPWVEGWLTQISGAEWYEVLTPALCAPHPQLVMQWALDVGLLGALMPELVDTVALSQEGGRRHKDVWEHTKTVVWQSVPRPAVRWAAVLHDIGKVPTRKFLPGGKVTFHGHAEVGRRMFRRGPAKKIDFPEEIRTRVEFLILHHLRPGQYAPSWSDAAVRRFAKEMGDGLKDLLDLGRADVTSRRPGKRKACLRQISSLATRIREIEAQDAIPRPLPAGLGAHLMEAFDLPPGKHLAHLRADLEARCLRDELEHGQAPEYYVEAVRRLELLEGLAIHDGRRRRRGGASND